MHNYNTRYKVNELSEAESVTADILEDLITTCAGSEQKMEQGGNTVGAQQSVEQVTENKTHKKKTGKKVGKKRVTASNLVTAIDKLSTQIKSLDERVERQEKRASVLSLSTSPKAHSSPKRRKSSSRSSISTSTSSRRSLPSPEELRLNPRIQRDVQRRMRQYDDNARMDETGMCPPRPLKSGRLRVGDQRV